MRRIAHLVILAAYIFSCGGHWYALQAVAWINMIRDYSHFAPLSQAVSMTFSGKYPCPICQAIAEKKKSEQEKILVFDQDGKKFFPPPACAVPLPASTAALAQAGRTIFLRFRSESPPTPPPRLALS